MDHLLNDLKHGRRANMNLANIIHRQMQIERARSNVFHSIQEGGFMYQDDFLMERNAQNMKAEAPTGEPVEGQPSLIAQQEEALMKIK